MNVGAAHKNTSFAIRGKLKFAANAGQLMTSQLRGQEHIVAPCSMIVEGVLHSSNADHPALALASEFGAIPQGWDGRPVVYNHPVEDGNAVSANRPAGWESEVVGQIFNTRLDDKTLNAELWLDSSRTPQIVIDGLKEGKEFEVSTGLFALSDETAGIYGGKSYTTIWRNIVPDHLAILEPGLIGACSIADGAGLRANGAKEPTFEVYTMSSAQISASQGNKKNDELAASAAGIDGTHTRGLMSWMPKGIQMAINKLVDKLKSNELSDRDTRTAVNAALANLEGFHYACVEALFSSYAIFSAMDSEDYEWHMYKIDYSVADGGVITLGSTPVEVRPETAYVPVVIAGAPADDASGNMQASTSKETAVDLTKEQLAALATQVSDNLQPLVANLVKQGLTPPAPAAETVAAAPAQSAEVTDALAFTANVRKGLVTNLTAQGYTEAELAAIPTMTLQRMASSTAPIGGGVDFSANAVGGSTANPAARELPYTPPTAVFPIKA